MPTTAESAGRMTGHHRPREKRGRSSRWRRAVARVLIGLTVVLLLFLLVAAMLYRHDLNQTRDRLATHESQVFHSQRYGDIEYRVVGEGPAILVSHGITGGVDAAEDLVLRWHNFTPSYRFIFVSRFGYLRSSLPEPATPRMQAAAYAALLDELGINQVTVAGNSAG